MQNFNFFIPLKKAYGENDELEGIASTISIDRDSERMSEKALQDMANEIMEKGVNLFGNHEHNWENTLGAIKQASIRDNRLIIRAVLDDPNTNPKIPMLLNKLSRGIQLGLSVGGSTTKDHWEQDKISGKRIKVIDNVKLFEVSVVGIPSNADSFLTLPMAIAKAAKISLNNTCPICFHKSKGKKCELCLYQK